MHGAQVAGQWRGDTALTLPLFWRRSTVSPVFFGRFQRSSLSLSRPLPTLSPSLIGHLASVDVKQHERRSSSDGQYKFGSNKQISLTNSQQNVPTNTKRCVTAVAMSIDQFLKLLPANRRQIRPTRFEDLTVKNIIDEQTLNSRPFQVPHSNTEQHRNLFVHTATGTTSVTTW